ncbi:ankyrin [Corynespora cassiicola Philippines]|uniref:Ankyrin n=1 Tax=Corynespora cassiicola Philippines TaxID=1448308 RepID=A0A2T2NCI3_CORCC|nr:ankyrin [Corynespora cassiicola Philippines]
MNLSLGPPDNLIASETPYNIAAFYSQTEEYLGMTANAPIEDIFGAAAPVSFQNSTQETHISPDFGTLAPAYQDPIFGVIMNSWVTPSISADNSFQAMYLDLPNETFAPYFAECLQKLPFKRMDKFLRKKGVLDNLYKHIRFPPVASGDVMAMMRPKSGGGGRIEVSRFPGPLPFKAPGIRFSSPPNTMAVDNQPIHVRAKLQSLQSWLPGEASGEQHGQNGDLISNDEILETKLIRILLFSMLNGFTGLGDISISDVVHVLGRLENVSTLFFQVLKASPKYVAKSLAESLFKIAIEKQDSNIVRKILYNGLIQVNTIVCKHDGQSLTAVQRAIQLRDIKTLKCLIEFSADINLDFSPKPQYFVGVITLLLQTLRYGERISALIEEIAQTLLKAGAKLNNDDLYFTMKSPDGFKLAFVVLCEILPTHGPEQFQGLGLYRREILSTIASNTEDEKGFGMISSVLKSCEQLHKGSCLQKVRVLLPYCKDIYPAVTASFFSRKKDIIEFMLSNISAFNTHRACREKDVETTPLAEAIRMQSDELIRICEDKGALEQLRFNDCFKVAIVAAASIGNESYVRKLLQHIPSVCKHDTFDRALAYSIRYLHDSLSILLLEEGTAIIESAQRGDLFESLYAATLKQDSLMVREILDRGIFDRDIVEKPGRSGLLNQAIVWGDQSIISDLNFAIHAEMISNISCLIQHLESGNESFLQFLIDNRIASTDTLDNLLQRLIHTISPEKAIRLVELGACPWNEKTLAEAAKHRLDILRALLEYTSKTPKWAPIGSGRAAAINSIKAGIPGLNALDSLISAGLVVDYDIMSGKLTTPVGLAIRLATEYQGTYPVIERLLKAGCNLDINKFVVGFDKSSNENLTAMLAAVNTQKLGLVKLLHQHGAEVNTQAKRGLRRTPLQLASQLGNLEIVKFLLQEGANVNAAPALWGGGTAIQLASISGNCNVLVELLNHGANVYVPPSKVHGRWPIEGAAEHGRLDMIALLFKVMKPEPEHCKRAMKLAERNGHMGCKEFIQEYLDKPGENLWSPETPWASNLGGEYINNSGPDSWSPSMVWPNGLGN